MANFFARRRAEAAQIALEIFAAQTRTESGPTTSDGEPGPARAIVTGQIVALNDASSPDGSWVMGYVESDDGSTRIPFIGTELPGCEVGRVVRLVGHWERHPDYGLQFRATDVESTLPVVRDGVVRYMVANIPHCGPARAERIFDFFGADCLTVLAEAPERLFEIFTQKIGEKLVDGVRVWAEDYRVSSSAQNLVRLMGAGMTIKLARRVQQVFTKKGEAEDVVLRHPYRLVEVPGIGFKRADQIARAMGVSPTDPSRIAAGVIYAMETAMEVGHSAMPRVALQRRAAAELEVSDANLVSDAIDRCLAAGTLVLDGELLFLPHVIETERYVARRIAEFLSRPRSLSRAQRTLCEGIIAQSQLTQRQAQAVWMAIENGISVLTGRPGSGKTTTANTFVKCCEALGWSIEIAAPTGKAAARAAEVTGRPAKTIHRLIGGMPGSQRSEPIKARVLLLDETSMADLESAAWLFRNVEPAHTQIVLVGDRNQLPSVGHGQVFADVIASGCVPVVELLEVHRQAAGSRITANANRLLDGKPLLLDNQPGTDFLFADVTSDDVGPDGFPVQDEPNRSQREQEEARRRLQNALRFLMQQKSAWPARDIQVLSPMKRGLLGVDALNALLQETLNPHGEIGPEIGGGVAVRVGDRVIQTKNDYTVPGGLFNGEQGEVLAVDRRHESVTVRFDDREITLRGVQLYRLRLAWCITVHRSQGSEFPYTILLYHTSHHVMLDRSLLYTAITRAKKLFVLVGNYRAIEMTLRLARHNVGRHTGLRARIEQACGQAVARVA